MEQKQTIEQQLAESAQDFANQFDPQSEHYHKGLQVQVPIGGKNIPKSMPTEYDKNYEENKKQLDEQENNPAYQKLSQIRDHFTQLKNDLNKLCIPYEAILRHQDTFKLKGNPNNQKHVDTLNKNITTEKKKLEEIIEKLKENQQFIAELQNKDYEKIETQLKEIMKNAVIQEFENKEQLSEYQFSVKKVSQLVFAEANKFLQEMKKIKGIEVKKQSQKEQE